MNTAFRYFIQLGEHANVRDLTPPFRRRRISQRATEWGESVQAQFDELTALPRGWSGYDNGPVTFTNASFALKLIETVCSDDMPAPALVPGSSGDIQIEWHQKGVDVEIHVVGPNNVRAWRSGPQLPDGEEVSLTNDFTVIGQWLEALREHQDATPAAAAR